MHIRFSDAFIDRILHEDCPLGDLTTELLGIGDVEGSLTMAPREDVTIAGVELATRILGRSGCRVAALATEGQAVAAGTVVVRAEGKAYALHMGWKIAQNVIETMTGIATRAARICAEAARGCAEGRICPVCVTRKNAPGMKTMSLAAATAGGCIVHRTGLSETVLVFAQHTCFLPDGGGIPALVALIPRLRARAPEKRITVEVGDLGAALALARAGVDAIQFEKFSSEELAKAVPLLREVNAAIRILAAGGITADNASEMAASGVDGLVTSWPYYGRPQDVQVTMRCR